MAFSMLFIAFVVAVPANAQTNTEREARINELTKQIEASQQSTAGLGEKRDQLSADIAKLEKERTSLQAAIAQNQQDQTTLVQKMAETEAKLKERQDALGQAMADAYIDETISPIEMLASSKSIGDFVDQHTYSTIVQEKLSQSISEVHTLTTQLAEQKTQMEHIAGIQKQQVATVSAQSAEQQKNLVVVNQETGKLVEITAAMAEERKMLQTQQQSTIAASLGGAQMVSPGSISAPITVTPPAPVVSPPPVSTTPGTPAPPPPPPPPPPPVPVVLPNGGYPSYLQNCYVDSNALSYDIDPWGYGCRQCVSYAAWKVLQKTGRPAMYWGNAKDWPASARRAGYATGTTPRPGSVAVMTTGPYGHVAWVESINANGTLNISQYNYWLPNKPNGGWGWYSEFTGVSPGTYQAYIYV